MLPVTKQVTQRNLNELTEGAYRMKICEIQWKYKPGIVHLYEPEEITILLVMANFIQFIR